MQKSITDAANFKKKGLFKEVTQIGHGIHWEAEESISDNEKET